MDIDLEATMNANLMADAGKGTGADTAISSFLNAIARHRHPERDTDPPFV